MPSGFGINMTALRNPDDPTFQRAWMVFSAYAEPRIRRRLTILGFSDADDAVQKAFDSFLATGATFPDVNTAVSWLVEAAKNAKLNEIKFERRTERRAREWQSEHLDIPIHLVAFLQSTFTKDGSGRYREAMFRRAEAVLADFSARDREFFVLRAAYGISHNELARVFHLASANASAQHFYRLKKRTKRQPAESSVVLSRADWLRELLEAHGHRFY